MYACSTKVVSTSTSAVTAEAASAASTSPLARRPRIRTLPGEASWSRGASGGERGVDAARAGGSGCQVIGSSRIVDGRERPLVADEREDRLAAMADDAVGERRLVLAGRVDPVAVLARHVRGGEHVDEARMRRAERPRGRRSRISLARAATGPRGRRGRPRAAGRRRSGRCRGPAAARRPSRAASRRRRRPRAAAPAARSARPCGRFVASGAGVARRRDRLDDLHVARAAAQHAADPVADRGVVGIAGRAARSASAAMSIPGVQMPHCAAPWARNAAWRSLRRAVRRRPAPRPSRSSAPSTCAAGTRHDTAWRPSSRTVHAPQSPASQPTFVPVSPRSSRRTSDRRRIGSTATRDARPLTANSIGARRSAAASRAADRLERPADELQRRPRAGTRPSRGRRRSG